jgi:hypothetical protein
LACSALELLINLNVLDGTLFPELSPEGRRAEISKGMESQFYVWIMGPGIYQI